MSYFAEIELDGVVCPKRLWTVESTNLIDQFRLFYTDLGYKVGSIKVL